ncbi:MAG TPA: thiamine diphosphokinase [Spirochaetia bacterium]|nr:thiamine diphosphokinase [Spirochaetia bacterium]
MLDEYPGLLLIGGDGPPHAAVRHLFGPARTIIAADSGFDLAVSYGVTPDYLVGDQDSIRQLKKAQKMLKPDRIFAFDREKDETDTEIGLRILHERKEMPAAVIGGGGGRLDHIIGLLALFDREVRPKHWFTDRDEVIEISEREVFTSMKGRTCSFFPVGEAPCRMVSTGLRWPLKGLTWRHGDVGISNVGVNEEVTIEMLSGRLIMVRSLAGAANG